MARSRPSVASRKRRKKVLKQARGFYGARRRTLRAATETLHRAWVYAYRDRKNRKREFRRLWITRIGAAAKMHGTSYSRLTHALKQAGVELNRKMLAEIAVRHPEDFARIVDEVRSAG
ncbi:50S ribosomal protein L20 [Deferrisoma camini]|uniref:50S ribosomal protein L20 n=1 Tax=Deferrisoma camini TaxID=1035120 RepID=UPI00046D0691|nr:50S ribosomal protein L20 [Deferrisoma camini]